MRTFEGDEPVGGGFFSGAPSAGSGIRVSCGDLDNDGVDEIITVPGPGQPAAVCISHPNGSSVGCFNAYDASYIGGAYIAVGDVVPTSPGLEIVTGADAGGGPHVRVFSAIGTVLREFFVYDPNFHGGVRVAAGDVDGDGLAEIITAPGAGGGPHVKAFNGGGAVVDSFMAYAPNFTGGVFVAAADLDGDAVDEIVTGPGAGGGPHVKMFANGEPISGGFMAYAQSFTGGVSVGRFGDDILGPNLIVVGAGAAEDRTFRSSTSMVSNSQASTRTPQGSPEAFSSLAVSPSRR